MKLLEYKGKELLKNYGIPVQNGVVVQENQDIKESIKELKLPFVLKVQIMAGGRGKAGGIKFADSIEEAEKLAEEMLKMEIKKLKVKKVLIAEKVDLADEWYLSIVLDRLNKTPMLIFSPLGGVDIEDTARNNPEKIAKIPINPFLGIKEYTTRYIFKKYDLDQSLSEEFTSIVKNLFRLFKEYDCTLVEINPLAIINEDKLLAVDCKADIDDSSLYRHSDIVEFRNSIEENILVKEARQFNFLYIPVTDDGNIAVVSNGSGMIMSCIDLITKVGQKVGAALDLGGGATSDRIAEAVKIIFRNRNIMCLFISIFGGITRCDEVAMGVKNALESGEIEKDRVVVIRLEGTNKQEALKILSEIGDNVIIADSISDGVNKISSRRF
ncbi:MAG TPA: ADP-forming succinate--CoA ligase subunit beta [Actinobacteria bacterium]|nr:ADP-forming succinate--CoA ligase subunit beta [Actinomycetota bacterium]